MAKNTILIIEDDADILESLAITLERQGFSISKLPDGKRAAAQAVNEKPHLIIMDVMMPPPDGIEVCRALKSNDKTKNIPLILLSARTQPQDIENGFKAGADRYITKPFQNEDLISTVKALIKPETEEDQIS